jgi:thiol:disulfide interchange protein DsbD
LRFERVRSVSELNDRVKAAGKPVMLDFYADWCVSCKEMERFTFSDPRVQERLSGWLVLQADVTANSDDDKALLARFGLFGPPGILFFNSAGEEIKNVRVIGFQSADAFLGTLASLPQ